MADYWILNAAGEPEQIDDLLEWARWYEKASRERSTVIAQDRDEQKGAPNVLVSTVFLALDHRHFGEGPPILWETMILGGPLDGYQTRYSSREAALVGHAKACEEVRRLRQFKSPDALFTLAAPAALVPAIHDRDVGDHQDGLALPDRDGRGAD